MKKSLTFILTLTFLFLFSGIVFGEELIVTKKYSDNGKIQTVSYYKNGKKDGLETKVWSRSGRKISIQYFKNGKEHGLRKEWNSDGKLFVKNFVDGEEKK